MIAVDSEERALTAIDVAKILGVSTATVARYAKLGILPASRLPRAPYARRFRERDILALQKKMVENPGPDLDHDQEVRGDDAPSSG